MNQENPNGPVGLNRAAAAKNWHTEFAQIKEA